MMDEKNDRLPQDDGISELDEELKALDSELEDLSNEIEQERANRSALREEREKLREQRRAIREQIHAARAAGNTLETEQLEQQLWSIRQQLEQIDTQLDEAEDAMDQANDRADSLQDQIESLRDEIEDRIDDAEIDGEEHDFLTSLGERMDKLLEKVKSAVSDIDWHAMGDQITRTVDSAFNGVYDAVKNVQETMRTRNEKPKESTPNGAKRDGRFSGSITLDGGDWDALSFSGSAKLTEDVRCASLHASGSVKAAGNITCAGEVVASGALKLGGNLAAGQLRTSGGVHVGGDLTVSEDVTTSGALEVGGSLSCRALKTSGTLAVGEDCTAETVTASGKLTVPGLLNAEEVHIALSPSWSSTIGSIGCGKLTTDVGQVARFFNRLFHDGAQSGALVCDSIEGDQLTLVATTAKTVRGVDVKIGPGCRIDQLEYSGTCEISPDASVGNTVKLEG